jgi:hypothetical protein
MLLRSSHHPTRLPVLCEACLTPELTGRGIKHPVLENRVIMKSIQSALRLNELFGCAPTSRSRRARSIQFFSNSDPSTLQPTLATTHPPKMGRDKLRRDAQADMYHASRAQDNSEIGKHSSEAGAASPFKIEEKRASAERPN